MTTRIYEANGKQIVEYTSSSSSGHQMCLEIWAEPWRLGRDEAGEIGRALLEWSHASGRIRSEDSRILRDEIARLVTKNAEFEVENEKLARALAEKPPPPGLEERKVEALEKIAEALREDGVIDAALFRIGNIVRDHD